MLWQALRVSNIVEVPDRKLEIQLLFNPEDQFEVEIQGDGHLVVRERDVHAVATERNDDGTGLYL